MKVLTLKQEPREKSVKVLEYKTETENRTEFEKLVSPSIYRGDCPAITVDCLTLQILLAKTFNW